MKRILKVFSDRSEMTNVFSNDINRLGKLAEVSRSQRIIRIADLEYRYMPIDIALRSVQGYTFNSIIFFGVFHLDDKAMINSRIRQ